MFIHSTLKGLIVKVNKKRKILIGAVILVLGIIVSVIAINITNNPVETNEVEISKQLPDGPYYHMAPLYGREDEPNYSDLFKSENSLERLKKFNEDLKNEFEFLEFCYQPLYYHGFYNMSPKFVSSYNELTNTAETMNQNIGTENDQPVYITDLKTLQIDKQIFPNYDNLISVGRNFNDSDFCLKNESDMVNVLLGNEYSSYYKLGDILKLDLHGKEISFRVIGFFDKGASLNIDEQNIEFDNYIVMPFYDIDYSPNNPTDEMYQKIFYSQKDQGYIYSKGESFDTLKSSLCEVAQKNDLRYTLATANIYIKTQD